MILVNGQELELTGSKDKGTDLEIFIKSKIAELRSNYKGRFPLVISFADNMKFKRTITTNFANATVIDAYPSERTIALTSRVVLFNDTVNIQYASGFSINGDRRDYTPRKLKFKGYLKIAEYDADLAFYMLFCNPDIENALECDEIEKIGVPSKGRFTYKFIDEYRENSNVIDFEKIKTRVVSNIYNDISNEGIKRIATLYNIADAANKPHNILRKAIANRLKAMESMSGEFENVYADFEIKMNKLLKKDSASNEEVTVIQLAEKLEKERYVRIIGATVGKRYWCEWDRERNLKIKKICDITANIDSTPLEALIEYLAVDVDMMNKLSAKIKEASN